MCVLPTVYCILFSVLMSLFARKPIADLQPVEGAHSLKRALGAGDLIMLAIGTIIGAGIFSSMGPAAAGEIRPTAQSSAPLRVRR